MGDVMLLSVLATFLCCIWLRGMLIERRHELRSILVIQLIDAVMPKSNY